MSVIHQVFRFAAAGLVLTLAACGGGGGDGAGTPVNGLLRSDP
jgi:hypothetical protein